MKPTAGLTERRAFWAEHVQAWRNSGMTQVTYCEHHKINTKSFGCWFRSRALENQTLTMVPIAAREVASESELKLRDPSG